MTAWPGNVPYKPQSGTLAVQADDNALRFAPDVGPDIRRARYTAVSRRFSFDLLVNKLQLNALRYFYDTTLSNGVTSFDFIDPVLGLSGTFSFAGPIGEQALPAPDLFRVSISLVKAAA